MDSQINAAARFLATGDPLRALDRVALRDDPPALALRGIAMAQLGDYGRARALLRRAELAFGDTEPLARARCSMARIEVALAERDLAAPARELSTVVGQLERHGDRVNATYARLLRARRSSLLGRIDEALAECDAIDLDAAPPRIAAVAELLLADLAVRRLQARAAEQALGRAREHAERARIPALVAEIERAVARLEQPAARVGSRGTERLATLREIEVLFGSDGLVVDGCRRAIRGRGRVLGLARRPVLFELARVLAEAWPGDASREHLLEQVFRAKATNARNESGRVRLRVEVGRLRKLLDTIADVRATPAGFALVPTTDEVAIVRPPIDGCDAAVLALLGDGAMWSTSALALALRIGQRTVQRSLAALQADGAVESFGHGRALRWLAKPMVGSTTPLLLPDVLHPG